MGASVTIVETNERLLSRIDPEAGALLAERFVGRGIEVRAREPGQSRSPRDGSRVRVELGSGETVEAARLLVATGRRPNVDGPRASRQLGVEVTRRGITVDEPAPCG